LAATAPLAFPGQKSAAHGPPHRWGGRPPLIDMQKYLIQMLRL
jgi:hypothetical protein